MSIRFRKSISFGKGARLIIGKKGLGFSVGTKGLRFGIGSKGAYTSTGIPGTGLYSLNYLSKHSKSSSRISPDAVSTSSQISSDKVSSSSGCLTTVIAVILLLLLIFFTKTALFLILIGAIGYFVWSRQPQQQMHRQLSKANQLLEERNHIDAIKLLKEILNQDKDNQDAIRLLALALYNSENYPEAQPHLEALHNSEPSDKNVLMMYSNCCFRTGNYEAAIKLLQESPENTEMDINSIKLLGSCFSALRKYDLAILTFKKAPLLKRNLDDDLLEVHYNLAIAYEESGDRKNAVKHLKKLSAHNMNYRDIAERLHRLET